MTDTIEAVANSIDDEFNKSPDDEPSSYQLATAAIAAYTQAVAGEAVGWFNPYNETHGYQQVAEQFEGKEGKIPLFAAPPAPIHMDDAYSRLVNFFDQDDTAGSFLAEDGDSGFTGAVYRMAREIDKLREAAAQQVQVKPLVWEKKALESSERAVSVFGNYTVWGAYFCPPNDRQGIKADDPKAAAQAHYESRIISALARRQGNE